MSQLLILLFQSLMYIVLYPFLINLHITYYYLSIFSNMSYLLSPLFHIYYLFFNILTYFLVSLSIFSVSFIHLYLGPVLPSLFSVQFNLVQFNSIQFRSVQFRPVQFSSALDNTFTLTYHYSFQFSSVQSSSVHISSVQFNSAVLCRREHALTHWFSPIVK